MEEREGGILGPSFGWMVEGGTQFHFEMANPAIRSPWAFFHRKPNTEPNRTEPKPNRIVGSSVFRFGFGFQFCEVRCSASASVSMPYRTEVPRNRIVGSPAGWNLFFSCCLSKLMEYCGLLSRMNYKFVIFDLSIELLNL